MKHKFFWCVVGLLTASMPSAISSAGSFYHIEGEVRDGGYGGFVWMGDESEYKSGPGQPHYGGDPGEILLDEASAYGTPYMADQDTDGVQEIYARIVRVCWDASGGNWYTAANWDQAVAPDEVMQVCIDAPATVSITGVATERTIDGLRIGGGAGSSMLNFAAGGVLTANNGVLIESGGVIRGNGRIVADVAIAAGGKLRVGGDEQFVVSGSSVTNAVFVMVAAVGGVNNGY